MTDAKRTRRRRVRVRNTSPADLEAIVELSSHVYPASPSWSVTQLESHIAIFPEGQFVALHPDTDAVIGMAASLIVAWEEYDLEDTWRDFTDGGWFTNHDPANGRTLYGAEVMVDPRVQRRGVGTALYSAREALVLEKGLLRIRAGARLAGYHKVAERMSAREYVFAVERGELRDPTLSFQLARGFTVIGVVSGYLRFDPESLGWAAVIEWRNPQLVR